jgi:hypothetical protein
MSETPGLAPVISEEKKKRIMVSLGFASYQCWKIDRAWRRQDAATLEELIR